MEAWAASFQNLGFDDANTNSAISYPDPFGRPALQGPITDLLPGWSLSLESMASINATNMYVNYHGLEDTTTLVSNPARSPFQFNVQGKYALYLEHLGFPTNNFTLSQTGDIPSNSMQLHFTYKGDPFAISINGVQLQPLYPPTSDLQNTVGYDIKAFAGQTVQLTLTQISNPINNNSAESYLDSIAFVVPEPSTLTLLSVGIGLRLWSRRPIRRTVIVGEER
jgi:hypothetical protein